ncbi:MAG: nitrilase-related carbon-nitrogen hydrolase [Anaerolineae bacterium]|jgi:predicted amidohydrolase
MKIGFVQFAPALGNLEKTMQALKRLIPRTAGADLVVLPELCNSGYNFQSPGQAWQTSEEVVESTFLAFLVGQCQERGFHIVSGFNERAGDCLYNSAVLVGPQGYVGRYRKLHLFMNEKDFFAPGDGGLPVFDIGVCRLGMLVCFDWIFPEAWRVLALRGADVICHPSNLVLPGLAQRAVPIRALTNRVYVVTANRIGTEDDLTFTGMSTIANPNGDVLAQASATEEVVSVVEVDASLAREKRITSRNDLFADRRPDAYGLLLEGGEL